jgi:hypothetical protein
VELRNCTVEHAGLEAQCYDRAFSISVIEHLPMDEVLSVMHSIFACLKPGGLFVLTVDLFLNLLPFTSRRENRYGRNIDIKALIEVAPFEIVHGRPEELYGFPGFDHGSIQAELEEYVIGRYYPALVQCLVLRKPD